VDIALFVFVPFCKIKCTYCDFNAYANLARVMEPYADAVVSEIQKAEGRKPKANFLAPSVYFGGGTPSLVAADHIKKILDALETKFYFSPDIEITLEANPATADAEKLRAYRAMGVNRLSIGVQSFDDAMLRRLNRGHTSADAIEMFDLARRVGFENLSLDFIYGLPQQTLADWRATLDRAIALAPEHLSLYALKVEEGTGLEHQIKRGKYQKPDDDLAADMYELAEEMLAGAGYEQYEISNWARGGGQFIAPLQSRHNLVYWHNQPYLGFGAGAHSYFYGARFWNVLSPIEYIARIESGKSVVAESEKISREMEIAETLFLGLRLNEGVTFDVFTKRFGEDLRVRFTKEMRELKELALIEWSDTHLRLTPRGRLLSNEVFWRFLPDSIT
jgi:oxygen-independent coproporphyrinogen III oxidase